MRVSLFVAAVAVLAFALPAQAGAARLAGVVVAKESQRGTVVLASARGVGTTVRISSTRAKAGDRVEISGRRLRDGTFFATALAVRSHTRSALIRGVVVRQLSRATLLATGRSVIRIQHGASSAPLRAGSGVTFRVRIDDHGDLDEQGRPTRPRRAPTSRSRARSSRPRRSSFRWKDFRSGSRSRPG